MMGRCNVVETNLLRLIFCILVFRARSTGYTGSGPLKGQVTMHRDRAVPMILSILGPRI